MVFLLDSVSANPVFSETPSTNTADTDTPSTLMRLKRDRAPEKFVASPRCHPSCIASGKKSWEVQKANALSHDNYTKRLAKCEIYYRLKYVSIVGESEKLCNSVA